jgi:hypothetical protein
MSAGAWKRFEEKILLNPEKEYSPRFLAKDQAFSILVSNLKRANNKVIEPKKRFFSIFSDFKRYLNEFFWGPRNSIPHSVFIVFIEDTVRTNNLSLLEKRQDMLLKAFWPLGVQEHDKQRLRTLKNSLHIESPLRKPLDYLLKEETDPEIIDLHEHTQLYDRLVRFEKIKETLDNILFPFNTLVNAGLSGLFLILPVLGISALMYFTVIPAVIFVVSLIVLQITKFIYDLRIKQGIATLSLIQILHQSTDTKVSCTLLLRKIKMITPQEWIDFKNEFFRKDGVDYVHTTLASKVYAFLLEHKPDDLEEFLPHFRVINRQHFDPKLQNYLQGYDKDCDKVHDTVHDADDGLSSIQPSFTPYFLHPTPNPEDKNLLEQVDRSKPLLTTKKR